MAEPQPPNVVEGANTNGEMEDEVQQAKSAEDRKAAAALASMDSRGDDNSGGPQVDKDAASKAMKSLGKGSASEKKEVKKVKVDPADVTLLMDELDMSKPKATELLKAHDGSAVAAMTTFITSWDKRF